MSIEKQLKTQKGIKAMEKYEGDYYLGFDVGTESVGYAVTDESYHVLDFRKRAMWGSRLFDAAQTAEGRRVLRTNRRRLSRRKWRTELLQELFAEEICKVDSGFYQRLKDSMLWPEDKAERQIYSLFNDEGYTDMDFYKDYPTIYHLRKALITQKKPFDVRLVYIALHHLVKHRGHFLFAGSVENAISFSSVFERLKICLSDELEIDIECPSPQELEDVLKDKNQSKKDKNSKVMKLLGCDKTDRQLKAVIGLMCGLTVKLADLFGDAALSEAEKASVSFAGEPYDELRAAIEPILQERGVVVDMIKAVYDWSILADILKGGEYKGKSYLSVAKVASYEKHGEDLKKLKRIIKSADEEVYRAFFQKAGKDNYCSYVGFTTQNGKKKKVRKCTYEDLKKNIKKMINNYCQDSQDKDILYILKELDTESFLPLQVTKDNGVIPYQVNEIELKEILENAQAYLPFLNETDEHGIRVKEKIISIFEFRVPYYVGPLNTHKNKNAWAVRKQKGIITPWNIGEKIDFDKSGEKFIRRMTNKCTYLVGKDVLPKNSLLYSEYMVWNEINNIRVGGEKLAVDLKQVMYDTLFKKKKHVKRKDILEFLKAEGMDVENDQISGIDATIKSGLISYHDFRKIFGENADKYQTQQMIERIICWITVYGDEIKMIKGIVRQNYAQEIISDEQLRKIAGLRYQGWGRLSREFLSEIEGADTQTGEIYTIISALRATNDNLMQLLSQRYTFGRAVDEENNQGEKELASITYANLLEDRVASPAVKRAAWQTVLIAKEIKKIMGKAPKKVFVEMTRAEGEKKRTTSRKDYFLNLYKYIKDQEKDWIDEIGKRDEKDFRSIKLYLYYTQMGRCMYTGEPIDLSQLNDATVYDRDHIYPQSKTKDDSIDNLVLVKRTVNAKKSNDMLSAEIQDRMQSFWKCLKEGHLISDKKYERLMRKTPLTDEELAGFINRQIVETSQSAKIVAEVMQEIFRDSDVVYVKAKAVSEFRQDQLGMVKVRSLNDYHHAKDAYLNIVVGNVYHEKFTNNPLRWLKETNDRNYSLNRVYDYDIVKNGKVIWKRGKDGSMKTVSEQMRKNNIQYTRYAATNKTGQNGGFFDQNPVSKDQNPGVPLKKGLNVNKYGGYKTVTPACFALVESENKSGKLIRSVEAVPLYLKEQFESGESSFERYCEVMYGLRNPRVIISQIKKDSCLVINKFPMHLRGTTGKQLIFQGAVQLCLDEESEKYLKKIEKYIQRNQERTDKRTLLQIGENEGLTKEQNAMLYLELCRKQKETIYKHRPNNQYESLMKAKERFDDLSCEEQCIVLNEVLWLLKCKPNVANLHLIGGAAQAGRITCNKVISNYQSAVLKTQSVTGLYEQTIDLLKI